MGNKTKAWRPNTEKFNYMSLQGRDHIRFLHLKKSTFSSLNCEISHVSLSEKPKYTALSYTWGSATPSYGNQCTELSPFGSRYEQSGILPLSENMNAFLHHHMKVEIDMPLWIDALCINQQDGDEKMVQVQMMGRIYRSAQQVTIWLGKGTPETDRAIDDLRSIMEKVPAVKFSLKE